jgi:hypothetical protein
MHQFCGHGTGHSHSHCGKTVRDDAGVGLKAREKACQPQFVCADVRNDNIVVG